MMRAASFALQIVIALAAAALAKAHAAPMDDARQELPNMHADASLATFSQPGGGDGSPIRASRDIVTGQCLLLIVPENEDGWDMMMRVGPVGVPREVKIRTVLAHELAHCRHANEVEADRQALEWTLQNRPQEFHAAAAFLINLRRRFTRGMDPHASAREVAQMERELSNGTLR